MMEDYLEQVEDSWAGMWEMQAAQQRNFNLDPAGMDVIAKARAAKDLMLGLYEEVGELSRVVVQYKAHILKRPPIEKINLADEAADILKYLIAIAQLYELNEGEILEAFIRKSAVIEDRAEGERLKLQRDTRVVISDLDNCIADLRDWQAEVHAVQKNGPAGDRMLQLFEDMKSEFYRGGGFRTMSAIPGAVEGLKEIREMGYKIVLVTARPYRQHKRVYGDTLHWLKQHGVPYDLLLFKKDKAEAVTEYVFPATPVAFVEDRMKHALEVTQVGVPVLLLTYEYNQSLPDHPLIDRVQGWTDIVDRIRYADERQRNEQSNP